MKALIEMSYFKDEDYLEIENKLNGIVECTRNLDDHNVDVVVTMPPFLTPEKLNQYPNLKEVFVLTAGYDRVDLDYIKSRNLSFYNTKDVFSIQIAEDIVGKILAFNRHFSTYYEQQKQGVWKLNPIHYELSNSTVGIIGLGSIGIETAKRIKAFDTTILAYKRHKVHYDFIDQCVTTEEGLKDLIKQSDYIVLSLPLNDETYHLVNDSFISMMKPDAVIINVARGDIIDQDALIEALRHHKIRGALLDVTSPEPLPSDHALWQLPNVLITPHHGSLSPYVRSRLKNHVIDTLTKLSKKELTENKVF